MKNMINWFEIPVSDINRAKKFYETVLGYDLDIQDFGDVKMVFFPFDDKSVSGSLCWGEWYKPAQDGTLIYLNANPDLSVMVKRIEDAGGKIIMEKKQISPEYGYMALFNDSEGNRLALHSNE